MQEWPRHAARSREIVLPKRLLFLNGASYAFLNGGLVGFTGLYSSRVIAGGF